MTQKSATHTAGETPGVVFKGRMMTLTVVEIHATDCDAIAAQIDTQLARAPSFFARMPVLVSLVGGLPDLSRLAEIFREADLVLVGLLDADGAAADAARQAGLGLVSSPGRGAENPPPARASAADTQPPPPDSDDAPTGQAETQTDARGPARLVTKPVRSGQQIYARGGDLVVTSSVSEGAELLADGHIHVYGALRGRALAGASGDTSARIFCRRFEPDLVAIAGCYKVADAIDEGLASKPVVVRLDNDNLLIELQE
ncbi:septum site-determining protein MinC [Salinisphaera sp.]|uniref:septum site-determining protein MinC n=1 Tax=Salinisphaera sp. TaxID=1914330 RepID=UPI000C4BEDC0|nr:septum site-determining protein MinC [Salinisphaera sp.]MAS08671.1 septum site-determining protein MinC [Salinisphaera sp.]|tara:strand:- start:3194 stop:3964 length:771 start_codon:yes stop_codon:yes gene_type:complete